MKTDKDIWRTTGNEEVYKVPEGYFDELYTNIISNKAAVPSPAWYQASWARWAALPVAGLALLFFLLPGGEVKNTTVTTATTAEECVTLACLTDDELALMAEDLELGTLEDFAAYEIEESASATEVPADDQEELIDEFSDSEL